MLERLCTVIRVSIPCLVALLMLGCGADLGRDQYGHKVAAERIEGRWLIINYWAEWCAPCRSEIPQLNALSAALQTEAVVVLGVNYDGLQGDELARAARQMGIEFTVLAENPAQRYQLPASAALPVTFIIDAQGKVRERLLGEQSAEGLQSRLQALRQQG